MTMSPRARSAIAVAALLATGLLAGCDDEDDPPEPTESVSEPTSPSSSTTTEPTPTSPVEPTLPADAEGTNQSAAETFVRFYWDVVNYATKTGDVQLMRELDQPSCEGCEAGIQGIERIYQRGGRIVGGDYQVVRLKAVQSASGRWTVVAHTKVGRQRAVEAGDLNREYPAGRDKWLVALARFRGAWSVSTLESL